MIRFNRIQTTLTTALSALVGLLGFQACGDDDEELEMYGTPYATFQINGRVTDAQGAPVRDARVISRPQLYDDFPLYHSCDTVTTDADGNYLIEGRSESLSEKMRVVCQPHGKRLEADSTEVTVDYTPVTDSQNSWHTSNGTAKVDFTLSESSPEDREPVTK